MKIIRVLFGFVPGILSRIFSSVRLHILNHIGNLLSLLVHLGVKLRIVGAISGLPSRSGGRIPGLNLVELGHHVLRRMRKRLELSLL